MMLILISALLWIAVGMAVVMVFEGGWLIMITDTRNTHHTWMALPSLVLCWVLWPLILWLPRWCFFASLWMTDVRPSKRIIEKQNHYRMRQSKLDDMTIHEAED